jgi:lipid II:glycine glycyltransferase (peptidoglycan interpeptide bridge formation enzyme)
MHAKVLHKSEEKLWNDFVISHPLSTIHQSVLWGKFQTRIPSRNKRWIVVLKEQEKIIGGTMLVRHKMRNGYCFLYASRGPLLNYEAKNIDSQMEELLRIIKPIAKEENAVFLRIDPPISPPSKFPKFKGFFKSHCGFQPEHTLIIDLTLSEAEILANMKQKGRYNIRLAEKKGVKVRISNPKNNEQFEKDLDSYMTLLKETTERDDFSGHNRDVYKNMLEILTSGALADLYIAEFNGEPVSALVATYSNETATYYYGVSSNKNRELMSPYLLQWTVIKDAKAKGYKLYDFLGISPEGKKNHPWRGVTEFKKKFGGTPLSYAEPQEYPFKKLLFLIYRLYKKT